MPGYRDRSNYDPYSAQGGGRPMRPFNAIQWIGFGLVMISIAFNLGYVASQIGWIPKWHIGPASMMAPLILGTVLVNSRREPIQDIAPELAAARKRWLLITIAVCAVVLGIATIFAMKGF